MFVDLTGAFPLFIPTICPTSLVVRTMGSVNEGLQGRLQRKQQRSPGSHHTDLAELSPSAKRDMGQVILYETFVPLDSGRHADCMVCRGRGCSACNMKGRQGSETFVLPPWEVSTLSQPGKGPAVVWRAGLTVMQQKDPKVYLVSVTHVQGDLILAGAFFKIDTLSPLKADRAPLQDARQPPAADAYGQILDDE